MVRIRIELGQEVSEVERFKGRCNQQNMTRVGELGIVPVELSVHLK